MTPADADQARSQQADHEHFGRIARLLTPSRRAVLEALAACGPMTPEQLAACWRARDPDLRPLVVQALPSMVSQSLWKLENLAMVCVRDKKFTITDLGREHVEPVRGQDEPHE